MKKPPAPKQPKHHKPQGPQQHQAPHHGAAKAQHHKQHVSASVQRARHQAALKAARTRAKTAKANQAKKRGLARGAECCVVEAVLASARLAGFRADGAALYRALPALDDGAAVRDVLAAAGWLWPVSFAPVDAGDPAAVIFGVDLPGAHAVADDGLGWWSWGERHDPWPGAVIEEAWAVTWGTEVLA